MKILLNFQEICFVGSNRLLIAELTHVATHHVWMYFVKSNYSLFFERDLRYDMVDMRIQSASSSGKNGWDQSHQSLRNKK